MKRKLIYVVLFLIVTASIMGPAIYAGRMSGLKQAADRPAGGEAAGPAAGGRASTYSAAENGVTPDRSAAPRADHSPSAGNTAGRRDDPAGAAGQGGVQPARGPAAGPPGGAEEGGCTVGIAVVGMNGELLYGPGNVALAGKNTWGVTALGALDATGLPYTVSARWPGFVEAVAGQRNKGQAGWMFKVNNEVPLVAAGQKTVNPGDKVIWWYSKSMGDSVPDWDGLVGQRGGVNSADGGSR
ncbi:MAG: DUF4430 domain-containing protein [Peptococcaceae bacterium]|nr:DUF4430 domain-containing protein [Peptococcaceae bacterium]